MENRLRWQWFLDAGCRTVRPLGGGPAITAAVGVFGAIGLIVSIGLRWQLLIDLPSAQIIALTVAAHATSRAAATSLMATQDYVRQGPSKARPLAHRMSAGRVALVVLLGVFPLAFLPVRFWFSLIGPCTAALLLGLWFRRRLGGYTGDCLGATQQVGELLFLLIAIALR